MELSFSSWKDNSDVLFCKGKKVDSFQTYPREMYLSSLARAAQCPTEWWQMCPPVYRVFVWGMLSKSGDSFLTVTVWRLPPAPGKTWVFGVGHTDVGLVVCLIPWLWCQEPCLLLPDPLLQRPVPTAQYGGWPREAAFLHFVPELTLLKL